LAGLFNPQRKISDQFEKGMMGVDTLGYEMWLSDQTVPVFTAGAYGSTTIATVSAAPSTTVSSIAVSALAGPLVVGDIVTFSGVDSVNRTTFGDTGSLAQFVVTQAQNTSDTNISFYPPMTGPTGGNNVQYQTVYAYPTTSSTVASPIDGGQVYRKNFVFHPTAVTAVFVDLPIGMPGTFSHREVFDSMSMRVEEYYTGSTDEAAWRLDVLYGYCWTRPEWACIVCDHT
jgi:hypothetical protein